MSLKALAMWAIVLSPLAVTESYAQPLPTGCGAASRSNQSFQAGTGEQSVRAIVRTGRDLSICPANVQVEAWVEGSGGARISSGNLAATVDFTERVQTYGTHTTTGKHWLIWAPIAPGVGGWEDLGNTASQAELRPPIGGIIGSDELPCDTDPAWPGCNSPIILDTRFNGYRLTSVDDGVMFDLDSDGVQERIAWTQRDSDESFLAMDRNGNGTIDNGSELFGTHTPTYTNSDGKPNPNADNGFEALKYLELHPSYGPGNPDGKIDAGDAAFKSLLLWRDANHNGISEPDELTPVSSTALTAISTEYRSSKYVDRHGNEFRLRSKAVWNIRGRSRSFDVFDIWLRTEYAQPVPTAADGQQ